jgi:serine/threonine protein kinase
MASRSGNIPFTQTYAAQMACGVSQLHVKDILHLDMKPANFLVFIYAGGRFIIKVADFGGSKVLGCRPGTLRELAIAQARLTVAGTAPHLHAQHLRKMNRDQSF